MRNPYIIFTFVFFALAWTRSFGSPPVPSDCYCASGYYKSESSWLLTTTDGNGYTACRDNGSTSYITAYYGEPYDAGNGIIKYNAYSQNINCYVSPTCTSPQVLSADGSTCENPPVDPCHTEEELLNPTQQCIDDNPVCEYNDSNYYGECLCGEDSFPSIGINANNEPIFSCIYTPPENNDTSPDGNSTDPTDCSGTPDSHYSIYYEQCVSDDTNEPFPDENSTTPDDGSSGGGGDGDDTTDPIDDTNGTNPDSNSTGDEEGVFNMPDFGGEALNQITNYSIDIDTTVTGSCSFDSFTYDGDTYNIGEKFKNNVEEHSTVISATMKFVATMGAVIILLSGGI